MDYPTHHKCSTTRAINTHETDTCKPNVQGGLWSKGLGTLQGNDNIHRPMQPFPRLLSFGIGEPLGQV